MPVDSWSVGCELKFRFLISFWFSEELFKDQNNSINNLNFRTDLFDLNGQSDTECDPIRRLEFDVNQSLIGRDENDIYFLLVNVLSAQKIKMTLRHLTFDADV